MGVELYKEGNISVYFRDDIASLYELRDNKWINMGNISVDSYIEKYRENLEEYLSMYDPNYSACSKQIDDALAPGNPDQECEEILYDFVVDHADDLLVNELLGIYNDDLSY